MLDAIRRHQQSWLTYLIFVALAVVFAVNFGPGSSSCRGVAGTSYAAVVNGDYIRQQDFAMLYGRQLDGLRRRAQAGNFELTEQMIEGMGIRDQVLEQLIQTKLLAQEANRRGLRVSDDELLAYLRRVYRVDEVTPEDYRAFVERNFQTTAQRFEQDVRAELAGQKMAQLVTDQVAVSDEELKADFVRERDRAMIDFVRFDLTSVELKEPTAAEIDKLLAEEPKAVEERYQADGLRYRTPERRELRHILIKVAKDASEADVARARSQLMTLKDQIESGADFAALAKEHSQDRATKDAGGSLGWRARSDLDPALAAAAFALEVNALTKEPVRTDEGLELVQLTTIQPSEPRPLEDVKREVATSILRERAADAQLGAAAASLLAALKAGKPLADLTVTEDAAPGAGKPGGKPVRHESPWIQKSQEAIPRIGIAPEMHRDIFVLTQEAPVAPRPYKVGKSYYVVVLKQRETPDLSKFEVEKETLRQQALQVKRMRVFQDWLQHLRAQADVQLNPALFGKGRERRGEG